jgi:hypothetical protein
MMGDAGELPPSPFLSPSSPPSAALRGRPVRAAAGKPLSRESGRGRGPPRSGGRVREGPSNFRRDCANDLQDRFPHAFRIGKNIVVPESQDTPTAVFEPGRAPRIVFTIGVLPAIGLDGKTMLDASEIDDEPPYWMLTAKF